MAGLIGLKFFWTLISGQRVLEAKKISEIFFLKFEKNRLTDPALFNTSDYPAVNELPSP